MEKNLTEILLSELLEEVKLLTTQTKSQALIRFNKEFLNSNLRKQMYESFDGERTLLQISSDLGCKLNTLQVFVQLLTDNDLVDYHTKGNARIISKSLSKIAIYYAKKSLEEV